MKRLVVICEGHTEKEFCQTILYPFLLRNRIVVEAPLIKKSMGGIVGWESLRQQIRTTLINDPTAIVTTFIDYYGLKESHSFPSWDDAHKKVDLNDRMDILENGMLNNLSDAFQHRFIPYIQLHEFEGLLFIDYRFFDEQFESSEIQNTRDFKRIFKKFPNPELINNGSTTAPSKRLMNHIVGYNKIVYGNMIADAIGLKNIMDKCPRFNTWLTKIIQLGK